MRFEQLGYFFAGRDGRLEITDALVSSACRVKRGELARKAYIFGRLIAPGLRHFARGGRQEFVVARCVGRWSAPARAAAGDK